MGSIVSDVFGKNQSPPPAPDYTGAARAQGAANVETARASAKLSNPNYINPLGTRSVAYGQTDPDLVTVTDQLSPLGQQRFDQEQRIIGQLGSMAESGLSRVGGSVATPFSFGGPTQVSGLNDGSFRTGPNAITRPGVNDFSADRQRVEQAIYSRLEPQLAKDREALRTQLVNRGFREGTEAYDDAMGQSDRQATDARMQAVLAGGNEQSRLFGMGLNSEQQAFQQNLASDQSANQAEQARLAQQLSAGSFQNQARQQAMQEAMMLRQLPLNEINALRSGAQVSMPQFQAFQGTQVTPPPIFNAAQAAGQATQNAYNAQQAQNASAMQGLTSLGSAAMMAPAGTFAGPAGLFAFSDRRLKSNIVRVGTHPLGIGVYEYDIFGRRELGVMADEVMSVKPHAVGISGGYFVVDYGAL